MKCPQCQAEATQVGTFWVCGVHGPWPEPKPFASLRVFLSYGHDGNEELVRRIKADLEKRGHDVWFDKTEIGVGKNAFAAHLAHFYGRGTVIGVHFCAYDKPDHRSAPRIIRTLAFQLATRLPDYRKLLLTLPEIAELDRKQTAAELFGYLLANPLKFTITCGRERHLIVIDALDEAGGDGRNELVEMLVRHAPSLPDWIGLVVTRPAGKANLAISSPIR